MFTRNLGINQDVHTGSFRNYARLKKSGPLPPTGTGSLGHVLNAKEETFIVRLQQRHQ
jgi:hypothetical protein